MGEHWMDVLQTKKLGRLLAKLIQFCLAHGIQLGIIKVLYPKEKKNELDSDDMEAESDHEMEQNNSGDEIIDSGDENEPENEEDQVGFETGLYEEAPDEVLSLTGSYGKVITKMRKIINR